MSVNQTCSFLVFLLLLISSCQVENPVPEIEVEALATLSSSTNVIQLSEVPEYQSELDCVSDQKLCIGFMIETGLLDDNSFYQAAFRGALRAETDLLATVSYFDIEPKDTDKEYADQISLVADEGYDLIVTVGPNLLGGTWFTAQSYPNTYFIGVDQNQLLSYENFVGINFQAEKSAFLAGALAAMMSKTNTIGFVLGEVGPTASRYESGFKAGAYAVDPNKEIIYALYPGDAEDAYKDPTWGRQSARDLMENGADVIFAAGGETAIAALNEVARNNNTICIGADVDQYLESVASRPCLASSIVRDIETEVFKLIAFSLLESFPTQNVSGSYKFAPFYEFEKYITADIRAFIREIESNMAKDTILIDGKYRLDNVPEINIER